MTLRSALSRHLPPRLKQLIKNRFRPRLSALNHRWTIAKAGLQPGDTVALVASAAEAARLRSDVRRFIKAARAKGSGVRLYILDLDLTSPPPEFSEGAVYRFWIDAAPTAGRDSYHGMSIPSDLSEAPYPLPDGAWATGFYKNGQPMLFVTRLPGGALIEYLDPSGQSIQRDEFDQSGRLIRRIDLDPGTGKAVVYRYVDSSGRTWLRMRIGIEGSGHPVWQFHPEAKGYDALEDLQVAWLRDHLRNANRARVLAGGNASRSVVQRTQRLDLKDEGASALRRQRS